MADRIIRSAGRHYQATVWSQKVDFKGFDGVKYVEKKN